MQVRREAIYAVYLKRRSGTELKIRMKNLGADLNYDWKNVIVTKMLSA